MSLLESHRLERSEQLDYTDIDAEQSIHENSV